jgi:hypothetical protein
VLRNSSISARSRRRAIPRDQAEAATILRPFERRYYRLRLPDRDGGPLI